MMFNTIHSCTCAICR